MTYVEDMSCCGVREIDGIQGQSAPLTLLDVAEHRFEEDGVNRAAYIFTDTTDSRAGTKLAKYIKDHNLGDVIRTKARLNGNSGNRVVVWTWVVKQANFRSWFKQHYQD